jgi:hypothetical protein
MELAERAGLKWDGKKWVEHPNDELSDREK